jgi:hypothetical protein
MTMPDPVGVSGPGAMSQRVDKQPMRDVTGLPYGEAGALREAQQQAPLPESAAMPPPALLSEPSERPGEPVTSGAALGPGRGLEALTAAPGQPAGGPITQALARAAASDSSGLLAQLRMIAEQKGL